MNQIAENNKAIALFMGYSQPHPQFPNTTYWYKKNKEPLTVLLYHNNYNHLMAVVEKIESIEDQNRCAIYNVNIQQTFIEIINNKNSDTIIEVDANSKKEAIYKACVDFIKWYNHQN